MPYAIFSKRTGICNRVTDELVGMLPSENMIEIDDESNFPRGFFASVEGQDANSSGFPLFYQASGAPTTAPQKTVYDAGTDRPSTQKHPPLYVKPTVPGGDREKRWVDIPLRSHPFAWTGRDLANMKYSCVLGQNWPFQVAIGEEFIDDTHIDTGNSSGYVLSEGRCLLSPAGILQTDLFSFKVDSEGVFDPSDTSDEDGRQYVFDTYYLDVEPDFPQGVVVSWGGYRWATNDDTGFFEAVTNEDYPTTELGVAATTATQMRSIRLKIQNFTSEVYAIENFLLMLRSRVLPYTP